METLLPTEGQCIAGKILKSKTDRESSQRSKSMKKYALTGGIGMGKSAAANFFSQEGIPLLDSDDLAREVVAPGQEGWIRLVDCYGDNILLPDRTLDRKKVAEIVFKEEKERRFLESVLHPLIRQRWQKWALELEAKGESLCMVVVPLLFESHLETDFDGVICLVTDPEIQLRRLQDRGMDLEDIQARIAAQWPIEKKISRSNLLLPNNGSLEELSAQVRILAADLRKSAEIVENRI